MELEDVSDRVPIVAEEVKPVGEFDVGFNQIGKDIWEIKQSSDG